MRQQDVLTNSSSSIFLVDGRCVDSRLAGKIHLSEVSWCQYFITREYFLCSLHCFQMSLTFWQALNYKSLNETEHLPIFRSVKKMCLQNEDLEQYTGNTLEERCDFASFIVTVKKVI